jgi:fucose 4-O-acetylase-like acetyltransferase
MHSTRDVWIDNAKGIAMLLIIIGHVSGDLTGLLSFQFVYGIHLTMFFLLSGYTLKKKPFTMDYVNLKFSRLMTPYFYTCVAILVMDIWNSFFINHDCTIATVTYIIGKDILRSFFASGAITTFGTIDIGTRIGAIWFLPALFFAILIFQGLLQMTQDSRKLGIVTFFLAVMGYISARFIWLPFSIQSGMLASFFLWIGYEVREQELLNRVKWYHYFTAQIIFLATIFYNYSDIGFVVAYLNDIIFSILSGLSGCLLLYLISFHLKSLKILPWIGRNSLYILCAHLFSMETMGFYLNQIINQFPLSGNSSVWARIILEILFALMAAVLMKAVIKTISYLHTKLPQYDKSVNKSAYIARDSSIDIARGILILLMIVAHFSIDKTLRTIIYSFHMVAFVVFSGYFYKKPKDIFRTLLHIFKRFLIPYIIFVIGTLLLNISNWSEIYLKTAIQQYILGMSFSKNILIGVSSVGPVYFILMLLAVRLIYMLVDYFVKDETYKILLVLILSFVGMKLGEGGYWLPWSMDVALYSLVFYQIGIFLRKYGILSYSKNMYFLYFLLSPVWAYLISIGGVELAVRNYESYGVIILGATAGVLLLYQLANYIFKQLPILATAFTYIGKSSMIVIIIHTMLGGVYYNLVTTKFDSAHILFLFFATLLQISTAVLINMFLSIIKNTKKTDRVL